MVANTNANTLTTRCVRTAEFLLAGGGSRLAPSGVDSEPEDAGQRAAAVLLHAVPQVVAPGVAQLLVRGHAVGVVGQLELGLA